MRKRHSRNCRATAEEELPTKNASSKRRPRWLTRPARASAAIAAFTVLASVRERVTSSSAMPFLSDASARVVAAIVPDPAPDCVAAWIAADTSASTASDVAAADSLAAQRLGFRAANAPAASSSSSSSALSSSPSRARRRPRATPTPTSPSFTASLAVSPRRDRLPRPHPAPGLFRTFPSAGFPRRSTPLPKMSDRSTCDA
mmetsp:Transcript_13604/g.55035  ORF Transcript_13604/g.55035 Transcript_13604/m.55035 type:complete len:201 (+) Transcript_13604:813-1415(+)